jgi:hypothetical protein
MAKGKKAKAAKRERRERRFLPQSGQSQLLIKALGGVGAVALGAGSWAQFGRGLMDMDLPPYPFAPYILAGGAALFGAAIWLGTSAEPPIRVGAGGIAVEKSELVRIPWHGVERIVWDGEAERLSVRGRDEGSKEISILISVIAHPLACAWIAQEAGERIPKVTDIPDEVGAFPRTRPGDGELLPLDPVQVVGKHCAESGRVIAYEPDARVCPRCEHVYHKSSVPAECACGASLAAPEPQEGDLKPKEDAVAEDAPSGEKAAEPGPAPKSEEAG